MLEAISKWDLIETDISCWVGGEKESGMRSRSRQVSNNKLGLKLEYENYKQMLIMIG